MRFRDVIVAELTRRQQQNPRYSLRGFARGLGVHHSTLSRAINGARPMHAHAISTLGSRLGLSADRVTAFISREEVEAVCRAIERSTFRPRSRWLASVSGISVDRVNIALQTLLRCGRLRMLTSDRWSVVCQKGVD